MIRRPPRSTQSRSSAASDVYKRQLQVTDGSPRCGEELLQGIQVTGVQVIPVKDDDPPGDILAEKTAYQVPYTGCGAALGDVSIGPLVPGEREKGVAHRSGVEIAHIDRFGHGIQVSRPYQPVPLCAIDEDPASLADPAFPICAESRVHGAHLDRVKTDEPGTVQQVVAGEKIAAFIFVDRKVGGVIEPDFIHLETSRPLGIQPQVAEPAEVWEVDLFPRTGIESRVLGGEVDPGEGRHQHRARDLTDGLQRLGAYASAPAGREPQMKIAPYLFSEVDKQALRSAAGG